MASENLSHRRLERMYSCPRAPANLRGRHGAFHCTRKAISQCHVTLKRPQRSSCGDMPGRPRAEHRAHTSRPAASQVLWVIMALYGRPSQSWGLWEQVGGGGRNGRGGTEQEHYFTLNTLKRLAPVADNRTRQKDDLKF